MADENKRVSLKEMQERYRDCMVRITVDTSRGLSNGAGFHIGDGIIVTARHVMTDGVMKEIAGKYGKGVTGVGPQGFFGTVTLQAAPMFPEDESIDLAVLRTDYGLNEKGGSEAPYIPVGLHLDDWIGDEFVLSRVLLMGYPRIPQSLSTDLVSVVGEVNAVIDKYTGPHPHFIISPLSRGGFSGGPVISEYGFLLGVLTESLIHQSDGTQGQDAPLGFASAVSVEPLIVLLDRNGLRPPGIAADQWFEVNRQISMKGK